MKRKKTKTRRKAKKLPLPTRAQLNAEIDRLTRKCAERSNECYLAGVKIAALEGKLEALKRAFHTFRDVLLP